MYIARLFKMSWNKRLRRWEKMHKGRRLWVACSTLHGLYGPLPEDRWTKEGSYHLANRWLDDTLGHRVATELDRQIAWADANDPDLAKQLRQRQRNVRLPLHHAVPDALLHPLVPNTSSNGDEFPEPVGQFASHPTWLWPGSPSRMPDSKQVRAEQCRARTESRWRAMSRILAPRLLLGPQIHNPPATRPRLRH